MNTLTIVLYIAGFIATWIILYYVVKAAIKNAIIEARSNVQAAGPGTWSASPDITPTAEHLKLQERYDKGEITFDLYQAEWKKLR